MQLSSNRGEIKNGLGLTKLSIVTEILSQNKLYLWWNETSVKNLERWITHVLGHFRDPADRGMAKMVILRVVQILHLYIFSESLWKTAFEKKVGFC